MAGQLENLGLPPATAKIISQAIIVVGVTALSFGSEAATVGTRIGIETVEEGGAQLFRTAATTQAFLQTLMSSSLIPQMISAIPGIKQYPWLVGILTAATELTIAIVAFKATPTTGAQSALQKLVGTNVSRMGIKIAGNVTSTVGSIAMDVANVGKGFNEVAQSKIYREIAPLKELLIFQEGFMRVLDEVSSSLTRSTKQTLQANEEIFRVNFSQDMHSAAI
jgi:hypothetical protein